MNKKIALSALLSFLITGQAFTYTFIYFRAKNEPPLSLVENYSQGAASDQTKLKYKFTTLIDDEETDKRAGVAWKSYKAILENIFKLKKVPSKQKQMILDDIKGNEMIMQNALNELISLYQKKPTRNAYFNQWYEKSEIQKTVKKMVDQVKQIYGKIKAQLMEVVKKT